MRDHCDIFLTHYLSLRPLPPRDIREGPPCALTPSLTPLPRMPPAEEIVSVVPELGGEESVADESGHSSPLSKDEPQPARPSGHGQLSTFKTYVNLVTVVIGAGIMALPQLPLRGGWVMSSLILLLVVLAASESGLLMWKAFMASRGTLAIATFEDLGREAFGPLGQILAALVVNVFLFGMYAAYVVLVGMQLENISQKVVGKQLWMMFLYPVFVSLALAPDLSILSRLVPLGMVAACTTAAFIIGKSLADASHWQAWDSQDIHSPWPQATASQNSSN